MSAFVTLLGRKGKAPHCKNPHQCNRIPRGTQRNLSGRVFEYDQLYFPYLHTAYPSPGSGYTTLPTAVWGFPHTQKPLHQRGYLQQGETSCTQQLPRDQKRTPTLKPRSTNAKREPKRPPSRETPAQKSFPNKPQQAQVEYTHFFHFRHPRVTSSLFQIFECAPYLHALTFNILPPTPLNYGYRGCNGKAENQADTRRR